MPITYGTYLNYLSLSPGIDKGSTLTTIYLDYFNSVQKLRYEKWLFIDHTWVQQILIVEGLKNYKLTMKYLVYSWINSSLNSEIFSRYVSPAWPILRYCWAGGGQVRKYAPVSGGAYFILCSCRCSYATCDLKSIWNNTGCRWFIDSVVSVGSRPVECADIYRPSSARRGGWQYNTVSLYSTLYHSVICKHWTRVFAKSTYTYIHCTSLLWWRINKVPVRSTFGRSREQYSSPLALSPFVHVRFIFHKLSVK